MASSPFAKLIVFWSFSIPTMYVEEWEVGGALKYGFRQKTYYFFKKRSDICSIFTFLRQKTLCSTYKVNFPNIFLIYEITGKTRTFCGRSRTRV